MSHKPPIPPEQQTPHSAGTPQAEDGEKAKARSENKNLKEEDQQGNTYQNTHNQGDQQNR